jgi:RNA polymerase sigma factor (sigma-70 family)
MTESPVAKAVSGEQDDICLLDSYRRDGDAEALARLYERYRLEAFEVARQIIGSAADADDAVQAAFIQVMRHARQFAAERGSVRAWLMTIVMNTARSLRRSDQRRTHRERAVSQPDNDGTDAIMVPPALLEDVSKACSALPERYRTILHFHYREGLPIAEVCRVTGLPENTVRSQLRRALNRVRGALIKSGSTCSLLVIIAALATAHETAFAIPTRTTSPIGAQPGKFVAMASIGCALFIAAIIVCAPSARTPQVPVNAITAIELVDIAMTGRPANNSASGGIISGDNRYLLFTSSATDLAPGDSNKYNDLYRKDRTSGEIILISRKWNTNEDARPGLLPDGPRSLSDDGNIIVFSSLADNLVANDTNNTSDVFIVDVSARAMTRITGPGGVQGDFGSQEGRVTGDGRFVFFSSSATTFVAGESDDQLDVFRFDRHSGDIIRVSTNDGAPNVSQVLAVSDDGNRCLMQVLPGRLQDENREWKLSLHVCDISAGSTRVICTNVGVGATLSADGRFVSFSTMDDNLLPGDINQRSDVYGYDVATERYEFISLADGDSPTKVNAHLPLMSADGRFVVFRSTANNVLIADTNMGIDSFVRDRHLGTTRHIWHTTQQTQLAGGYSCSISKDGTGVLFRTQDAVIPEIGTTEAAHLYLAPLTVAADR